MWCISPWFSNILKTRPMKLNYTKMIWNLWVLNRGNMEVVKELGFQVKKRAWWGHISLHVATLCFSSFKVKNCRKVLFQWFIALNNRLLSKCHNSRTHYFLSLLFIVSLNNLRDDLVKHTLVQSMFSFAMS